MVTLRRGLEASGLTPTIDPDEAFFVGRHPS
jgi:4-hydroxy-tetrahydrodipicolinate synthase